MPRLVYKPKKFDMEDAQEILTGAEPQFGLDRLALNMGQVLGLDTVAALKAAMGLITTAIEGYRDEAAWTVAMDRQETARTALTAVAERWSDVLGLVGK